MLVIMLCHNVGLDHNKKHTTKSHNVCSQHSTPAPQIERMPLPRSTPSVQEHVLIAELLDKTTAVAPKSLSNRGWIKGGQPTVKSQWCPKRADTHPECDGGGALGREKL
jgi:hypothetical protein